MSCKSAGKTGLTTIEVGRAVLMVENSHSYRSFSHPLFMYEDSARSETGPKMTDLNIEKSVSNCRSDTCDVAALVLLSIHWEGG